MALDAFSLFHLPHFSLLNIHVVKSDNGLPPCWQPRPSSPRFMNQSESESPYGLVVGGGGSNGYALLGALEALWVRGRIDSNITAYAGTSIGSVLCLMLSCGWAPHDVFRLIWNITPFEVCRGGWSVLPEAWGLLSLDPMLSVIRSELKRRFGMVPTLKELHTLTGKELWVTVTNLSRKCVEHFHHTTHPDVCVVDAVHMSCSLPIVFSKVTHHGDIYVDGGLLEPFPLSPMRPFLAATPSKRVIGVTLDNQASQESKERIDTFLTYVTHILAVAPWFLQHRSIQEHAALGTGLRVVRVPRGDGTVSVDLTLTGTGQVDMYAGGFHAADQWVTDQEEKEDKDTRVPHHAVTRSGSTPEGLEAWHWEEESWDEDLGETLAPATFKEEGN